MFSSNSYPIQSVHFYQTNNSFYGYHLVRRILNGRALKSNKKWKHNSRFFSRRDVGENPIITNNKVRYRRFIRFIRSSSILANFCRWRAICLRRPVANRHLGERIGKSDGNSRTTSCLELIVLLCALLILKFHNQLSTTIAGASWRANSLRIMKTSTLPSKNRSIKRYCWL